MPFTGEGDVVVWLKKGETSAYMDDVVSLLLLYIERDALALYIEIYEDDQIEAQLKEVFINGNFKTVHGQMG